MDDSSNGPDASGQGATVKTGIVGRATSPLAKKWLGRGSWAIADQAVYGLSTFLVNVLLGSWVEKSEYGAFAIAFSALILILAFYNAIFVEPMLVFGSNRYNSRFRQYLKTLLKGHGLFSILCVVVLAIVGYIIGLQQRELAHAMYGLGIAMPFFLLAWLMRRACYVNHNPRLATLGGLVSVTVVISFLLLFRAQDWLSPFTALCSMGIGGLASGVFLATALKVGFPGKSVSRFSRLVAKRHWVYGRWALAARLPMRIPRIIILSALPIWAGLEATGTLHALSNPIMPTVQVIGAISLLLIPTLSRVRDTPKYFKITAGMLAVFVLVTCVYWVLIGTFDTFVIDLLYSGKYIESAGLLWYLGAQPVFTAAVSVLGAGFSAVEKPKYVFWAYLIGTIIGLPLTLYLMSQYQLIGAIVGSIVMNLITTLVLCVFFVSLRINFNKTRQSTV